MLTAVQTSGERPPLFLVHGVPEAVPLARGVAAALGADQPLYLLDVVTEGEQSSAGQACEDIRRIRASGALRIAGMRNGALPAIDIARRLLQEGRQVGPVILIDPPSLTGGEAAAAFSEPAEVILTPQAAIRFFHPQTPWQKLLCGPRIVHVLPWNHEDLFQAGREEVARLLKFILEQIPTFEAFAQGPME